MITIGKTLDIFSHKTKKLKKLTSKRVYLFNYPLEWSSAFFPTKHLNIRSLECFWHQVRMARGPFSNSPQLFHMDSKLLNTFLNIFHRHWIKCATGNWGANFISVTTHPLIASVSEVSDHLIFETLVMCPNDRLQVFKNCLVYMH